MEEIKMAYRDYKRHYANCETVRGYIECLKDLGILTDTEVRAIYMHYATPWESAETPHLTRAGRQPAETPERASWEATIKAPSTTRNSDQGKKTPEPTKE